MEAPASNAWSATWAAVAISRLFFETTKPVPWPPSELRRSTNAGATLSRAASIVSFTRDCAFDVPVRSRETRKDPSIGGIGRGLPFGGPSIEPANRGALAAAKARAQTDARNRLITNCTILIMLVSLTPQHEAATVSETDIQESRQEPQVDERI
jgi:hypothetical protein